MWWAGGHLQVLLPHVEKGEQLEKEKAAAEEQRAALEREMGEAEAERVALVREEAAARLRVVNLTQQAELQQQRFDAQVARLKAADAQVPPPRPPSALGRASSHAGALTRV